MGLENYVKYVVEEKDMSLCKYLDWQCGTLKVSNKEIAEKIVKILNDSGEFTIARYDERNERIHFGS
jgi:DNA-directed RNA polymerase specialized sigma54-like protein